MSPTECSSHWCIWSFLCNRIYSSIWFLIYEGGKALVPHLLGKRNLELVTLQGSQNTHLLLWRPSMCQLFLHIPQSVQRPISVKGTMRPASQLNMRPMRKTKEKSTSFNEIKALISTQVIQAIHQAFPIFIPSNMLINNKMNGSKLKFPLRIKEEVQRMVDESC